MSDLQVKFANPQQKKFYYSTARNQCFSGGFNNGKTFAGCLKGVTLLNTFPNSRLIIARQKFSDLKATTQQTFFKICPPELIERNNFQDGITLLKNRSQIKWMHLDGVELSTLRGIEANWVMVDQAEEVAEEVYDVLEARIGRWDGAEIPEHLLNAYPNWAKNEQNKYIIPSYIWLLCNPDTQFHFIYRKYHPDSLERRLSHFFVEGEWDPTLGSRETYNQMLQKGEEWVEKYIKGAWGRSDSQIHRVYSASLLDYTPELFDRIRKKGNLFRILDHGDTAPTCCLWAAVLDGVYIFYREYYTPKQVISYHRRAVNDLSIGELYSGNYADPAIFAKSKQKDNAFWTVALEYSTGDIDGPPLHWTPADNNEFATRNRINELLRPSQYVKHPVTGEPNAPRIYFIKRSAEYPNGCFHTINETQSQRRKFVGYVDGKAFYSDDREDNVSDHSYDCVRYFVAAHGRPQGLKQSFVKPNTIAWFKMMSKRQKGLVANSA